MRIDTQLNHGTNRSPDEIQLILEGSDLELFDDTQGMLTFKAPARFGDRIIVVHVVVDRPLRQVAP